MYKKYFYYLKLGSKSIIEIGKIDFCFVIIGFFISLFGSFNNLLYIYYWKNILLSITEQKGLNHIIFWVSFITLFQLTYFFLNSLWENKYKKIKKERIVFVLKKNLYTTLARTEVKKYCDPIFLNSIVFSQEKYINALFDSLESFNSIISSIIMGITLITIIINASNFILLAITFVVILTLLCNSKLTKLNYENDFEKKYNDRESKFISRVFNTPAQLYEVKVYGYIDLLINMLKNAMEKSVKIQKKNGNMISFVAFINSSILIVFEFFLVIVLSIICNFRNYSVGDFSVFINSIWSLTNHLNGIFNSIPVIYANGLITEEFLKNSFNKVQKKESDLNIIDKINKIEFKNVCFFYAPSKGVSDLNFRIKRGETLAVLGHNGSGKSTLIKLILKLYKPDKGQILFNDINSEIIDDKSLRKRIGICLQENHLFPFTISEFISGMNRCDLDRLNYSCKLSGFQEIIKKYNLTEETYITQEFNKQGVQLSGGEQQKLFISRAIYNAKDLLIFDEESTYLDSVSKKEILEYVEVIKKDKIFIHITHDILTTTAADKIVILEQGKIVEYGCPKKLLKNSESLYAKKVREESEY